MASSSTFSGSTRGTDDFTSSINSFFDVLAKRSKLLIALGVAVLVAIAIFALIASHNAERMDAGRSALFLAEKSLDTQLEAIAKASAPAVAPETPAKNAKNAKAAKKPATPPAPTPDMVQFKKLDVDTQLGEGITKLKAVAQEYSGTRPGFDAMLLLGKTYLDHGSAAQAAEWFDKSSQSAPSTLDRAVAFESLGYAHENEGKYKEALDAFERAIATGEMSLKGDLLLSKARVYQSMNDATQAKASYDAVIGQFPGTEYAKLAELFKARLK